MKNAWKLLAALAVVGGLAACNKGPDNGPEEPVDPSAKCCFAYATDLTPISDEYICQYNSVYKPDFVAFDGTKVLPVDGERHYITFEFIGDSKTYFAYSGISAEKFGHEGWMYGFGSVKGTTPGQEGAVRVTYDDGNLKFGKTLILIADPTGSAEAVDLGLNVKWASHNVGATAPEGYGYYFAWGETTEKTNYDWSNEGEYKWGIYDSSAEPEYGMTKYTADVEGGDGLRTLQPGDDPATVNWGNEWRTPTIGEVEELFDNTKCEWTWDADKKGYNVKGLATGNSIFLPAAGLCYSSEYNLGAGTYGHYWSSSVHWLTPCFAVLFDFHSDFHELGNDIRCCGYSVRAVTEY